MDEDHGAAQSIFDSLPDDPFDGAEADEISNAEEPGDTDEREEEALAIDADAAAELTGEVEEEEEAEEEEAEEEEAEEEAEEEESEEAADEVEETESEETDEPATFSVKVDGEKVAVTLEELQAGYSRTASWTRRSQKLADEKRGFESEMQAVRAERAQYAGMLDKLNEQLGSTEPQPPTTSDPQAWDHYHRSVLERNKVAAERSALQQRMVADEKRIRDDYLREQQVELASLYPEWADESVALADKAGIAKYALELGFSETDVDGIEDHRVVVLLRKAMAHDAMETERAKPRAKAKAANATLKPGRSKPRQPAKKASQKRGKAAREQLKESGHVDDAAAFIHDNLLEDF